MPYERTSDAQYTKNNPETMRAYDELARLRKAVAELLNLNTNTSKHIQTKNFAVQELGWTLDQWQQVDTAARSRIGQPHIQTKWTPPTSEQIAKLRAKADSKAATDPQDFTVSIAPSLTYTRGDAQREYVMVRDNITSPDRCEFCFDLARNFEFDGTPRFTIHHMKQRHEEGIDRPENMARLHYDCHDISEHGSRATEVNQLLKDRVSQAETGVVLTPQLQKSILLF